MQKDNLLALLNKWTNLTPTNGKHLVEMLSEYPLKGLDISEVLIMEALKHILNELEELKKK